MSTSIQKKIAFFPLMAKTILPLEQPRELVGTKPTKRPPPGVGGFADSSIHPQSEKNPGSNPPAQPVDKSSHPQAGPGGLSPRSTSSGKKFPFSGNRIPQTGLPLEGQRQSSRARECCRS